MTVTTAHPRCTTGTPAFQARGAACGMGCISMGLMACGMMMPCRGVGGGGVPGRCPPR